MILKNGTGVNMLSRYRRQISLDGFGVPGQEKLTSARVLVAGVGGLGGTVALYLAAAGIGKLSLVHQGELDLSDLNRQILMDPDWLGKSRVECARETLRKFNPDVDIDVIDGRVNEGNVMELVSGVDLVVSCRYNFEERDLLNRACVALKKPMVEAAMYGMEAYLTTIVPGQTPCLRCIYPEFPDWDPMAFPVLGAVSGTLGCLAATEAVKSLTGTGFPLSGWLLHFDLTDMTFKKLRLVRQRDCAICAT